ncbi:MAG: GNAT family N-acetyltransferase [Bacteroidales bacterium]|nr:GNAT family N-acetyltransferase [Bacteroidales bacterium]
MVEVREVRTRAERKAFVEFPLKLYKGNPWFCPPLYSDEMAIFGPRNIYNDTCDTVYYNAYREGVMVGRICGIIQKSANAKNGEKRARFGRFDSIDDQEVADALFNAVESWAVSMGMDTAHGPLGFSDLEREGLLIEGFDQPSTFEEQYNFPYYQKLIEACGYTKEVDWTESQLRVPANYDGGIEKLGDYVMKRFKLRRGPASSVKDFIDRYADGFFELIDKSYDKLYGTVPFTDAMKKQVIDAFRFIVDLRFVAVVLDENDKMVAMGACFPSIADAVRPSGGRITPGMLLRFLKARRKPRVIELGLVGVDPDYMNMGIGAAFAGAVMQMLREDGVEYAETNLNLEDNIAIQSLWNCFDRKVNKRRRAYVKKLV